MGVVAVGAVTLEVPLITMRGAVGSVLLAHAAVLAARRFLTPSLGIALILRRAGRATLISGLYNRIEQGVLALCIWPAAVFRLVAQGPRVCVALVLRFTVARGCFWFGYHHALMLRAFGFAASFYQTVMVLLWVAVVQFFRFLSV